MCRRLTEWWILFLFIIVLPGVPAENSQAGKGFSVKEYIEASCRNNPEFKKILIEKLYLEYRDDLDLDIGEIIAEIETSYLYSLDTDAEGMKSGITIGRLFPDTGTEISLNYQTSPAVLDRNSAVSINISQEIAGNAFGKRYRLEKKNLDFEKEIIRYQIAEAYEDYIYYLITVYFDWLSSYRTMITARNSYKESIKLLDNITDRKRNSIADDSDVNRITLQSLSKEESVSLSENEYRNITDLLRDTCGCVSEDIIYPVDPSSDFPDAGNLNTDDIKKKSRTYRMLSLYEKIGITEVQIKKHNLLPSVSLFSEIAASGKGYGVSDETERTLSLGISLSGIGERRYKRAALETSRIDLDKQMLENRISVNDLDIKLKTVSGNINNLKNIIKIYERKIRLSEMILESERKKFNIGKTDLSSLIDAINALDENRIKKREYESEINIYKAQWLSLTDSLVTESGPEENWSLFPE